MTTCSDIFNFLYEINDYIFNVLISIVSQKLWLGKLKELLQLNILTTKYKQTHYTRLDLLCHWSNRQTIQRKPCRHFLKETCSETTMKCP